MGLAGDIHPRVIIYDAFFTTQAMSNSNLTLIQRSALVPYGADQMYTLVADVDRYNDFLPWCKRCSILSEVDGVLLARMDIARGPLHKSFTTRNRMHPGESIELSLVEGPFNHLEACWRFADLGTGGSRVSLDMEFEMASRLLRMTLTPVFSEITNSMVGAFCKRATVLYGS